VTSLREQERVGGHVDAAVQGITPQERTTRADAARLRLRHAKGPRDTKQPRCTQLTRTQPVVCPAPIATRRHPALLSSTSPGSLGSRAARRSRPCRAWRLRPPSGLWSVALARAAQPRSWTGRSRSSRTSSFSAATCPWTPRSNRAGNPSESACWNRPRHFPGRLRSSEPPSWPATSSGLRGSSAALRRVSSCRKLKRASCSIASRGRPLI
jgi:hypothetical protein